MKKRIIGNSVLRNCASTGTVTGGVDAGGLVGSIRDKSCVLNSYTTCNVSEASRAVGGLVGRIETDAAQVYNCYCAGNVSGITDTAVGAAFGAIGSPTLEGIWYKADTATAAVGAGSATADINSFAYGADGYKELADALNVWVASKLSNDYLTWTHDLSGTSESEVEPAADTDATYTKLPVFGAAYSNWLMDFMIQGPMLSFTVDVDQLSGDSVYMAAYDTNGKMLALYKVIEYQESNDVASAIPTIHAMRQKDLSPDGDVAEYSLTVPTNTAYAKAFVFDDAGIPNGAALRTA